MGKIEIKDSNIDIVFLGEIFLKEIRNEIYEESKGSAKAVVNALQWNTVKYLDIRKNITMKIINSVITKIILISPEIYLYSPTSLSSVKIKVI